MTPKARSDVHVNLPALQKLDSMLIVCCHCVFISIKISSIESTIWICRSNTVFISIKKNIDLSITNIVYSANYVCLPQFGFTNGICNQICRKFWTRWWTQSIGTWRVVADQVAGAKIMVKGRPKSGGFHPLVSLNKGYLSSREKGLCFRLNLFIKSSKLRSLSMNKPCFRSLFPWLLWTPFQRQAYKFLFTRILLPFY